MKTSLHSSRLLNIFISGLTISSLLLAGCGETRNAKSVPGNPNTLDSESNGSHNEPNDPTQKMSEKEKNMFQLLVNLQQQTLDMDIEITKLREVRDTLAAQHSDKEGEQEVEFTDGTIEIIGGLATLVVSKSALLNGGYKKAIENGITNAALRELQGRAVGIHAAQFDKISKSKAFKRAIERRAREMAVANAPAIVNRLEGAMMNKLSTTIADASKTQFASLGNRGYVSFDFFKKTVKEDVLVGGAKAIDKAAKLEALQAAQAEWTKKFTTELRGHMGKGVDAYIAANKASVLEKAGRSARNWTKAGFLALVGTGILGAYWVYDGIQTLALSKDNYIKFLSSVDQAEKDLNAAIATKEGLIQSTLDLAREQGMEFTMEDVKNFAQPEISQIVAELSTLLANEEITEINE